MTRQSEVFVVVDLAFGDAGKGTIVDFLVRERAAHTVVRWHGGAQAGHRVVTPDGRAHVFSQLGAGSFVPGVRTHLAGAFVLHPSALLREAGLLAGLGVEDALARLSIDRRALVITPFAQASNRLHELARGGGEHGTCGIGFGETVRLSLEAPELRVTLADLARPAALPAKLRAVREHVRGELSEIARVLHGQPAAAVELDVLEDPRVIDRWIEEIAPLITLDLGVDEEHLAQRLREPGTVVFEGAQGVLLDEWAGFHPHTTWSTCVSGGATRLLDALGHEGPRTRLGLLRSYATRHGAGPLPSEDSSFALPEAENDARGWQGNFRQGALDLVLLRYALEVSPVDALAVTHLDHVGRGLSVAVAHRAEAPDREVLVTDPRAPQRVVGLRPSPVPEDLDYQARLTRAVEGLRPELEALPSTQDTVLSRIAEELALPVLIASAGPSAADKRWLA